MAPNIERTEPPLIADERTSLAAWLDFHRSTLRQKCEGLTGEQLVVAAVPPSGLTLLGLVQHMMIVEWWWFDHIFAGSSSPGPMSSDDDPDIEFHDLDPTSTEDVLERFIRQCERSREIVSLAESLDVLSVSSEKQPRDLRWVMTHMIEEYARHNGHADFLRECIDGVVGD
jgi:hypothetical protein